MLAAAPRPHYRLSVEFTFSFKNVSLTSMLGRSLNYVQALAARPRQAGAAAAMLTRRLNGGTLPASYDNIIVEKRDRVALITLHRPKALNALNSVRPCARGSACACVLRPHSAVLQQRSEPCNGGA